jgi:hypothetical protein
MLQTKKLPTALAVFKITVLKKRRKSHALSGLQRGKYKQIVDTTDEIGGFLTNFINFEALLTSSRP